MSTISWASTPSGASTTVANPTSAGLDTVPTLPAATVDASAVLAPVATNLLGANLAWWDDKLSTPQTQQMVEAAGLTAFRFPGGSSSDDYHFNFSSNLGDSAANTIPQFARFIEGLDDIGLVTLDYGSGSPQEAAAELAYLEGSPSDSTVIGSGLEWNDSTKQWQQVDWQTVGYWASLRAATPLPQDDGYNFLRIDHPAAFSAIKYWELGNEQYGSWEIDHHGTPGPGGVLTGALHDPATYAAFARTFAGFAAEIDPGISIGIDSGDPTGASDNNWTKNVLTQGDMIGFVPGFISDHNYMEVSGQESDSTLLLDTVSNPNSLLDWSTRYVDYHALLQEVLGSQASSIQIMATEFNSVASDPGKQTTSLVNGLFIADSLGSLLDSGYTGGFVWDLRNGWDTKQNNSPSLYGWRQGGDYGLLGDSDTSNPPSTGPYVPYPSYFAEQLASKLAQAGGRVVLTTSNVQNLTVYAVLEANGHLELLAINKDPNADINDRFNLQGFTTNGQAQVWQYGEEQDNAQSQMTDGSAALANDSTTLVLNGSSFNYTLPAYSMTVLDLAPALTANEQYVTAVYEDVLRRAPDSGGLEYWADILDHAQSNGSLLVTLSSVAMQIGHSAEYYGNFVTTAYEKYLGRRPDQAGLNAWVQAMLKGLSDQDLEAGLAASDEFYTNAGGANIAWIDAVYKLVLGRSAESGGEQAWNSQLNSLLSTENAESARLQLALGISESTENNSQLINADYEHYLGRAADPSGLQSWLTLFADGASNEEVIAGFTGSAEYYKNKTGIG